MREFERRLRAAARGEKPDTPSPVDAHLRALAKQLRQGAPASSAGYYKVKPGPARYLKRKR